MLGERLMFHSPADYLTPELKDMLMSPETPIETVLALPYCTRVANAGYPAFQAFMMKRCDQLLKVAFSEEMSTPSTNAFKVFCSNDKCYLEGVLKSGGLCDIATELLTHKDVPSRLLGRLSAMTLRSLITLPDLAFESCAYIYRLLPYCENPTVFNLFETLTSKDANVAPAQQWLKELGFAEFIERELTDLDFEYKPESSNAFKDPVFNRACYLFILVATSCESPIFGDAFRVPSIVKCLSKKFENQPDFVTTAQWRAIVAVTCEKTAPSALVFIRPALDMLTEPFEKLLEYRVAALLFVTKMLRLAPLTFDLLLESQMPQMLINLVLQFPNSTILHNAFLDFVSFASKNSQFVSQIINFYVPVAINYGESQENRILKPCCIKIMDIFLDVATNNKDIELILTEQAGVARFVQEVMQPYRAKVKTPFGGDLPMDIGFLKSFFGNVG